MVKKRGEKLEILCFPLILYLKIVFYRIKKMADTQIYEKAYDKVR